MAGDRKAVVLDMAEVSRVLGKRVTSMKILGGVLILEYDGSIIVDNLSDADLLQEISDRD
jgi:vacuolar-type H+-ATPase subunit E/Vma4